MLTVFFRTLTIYLFVFAAIRLTGKRQISELQPFDLVITILIADVASNPISNNDVPLAYGIIPIIALFLMQRFFAYLSLKNKTLRTIICGNPLLLIEKGIVNERLMKVANYSLTDLMEQLRSKDYFSLNDVNYAVLECNGELGILPKAGKQPGTPPESRPAHLITLDGKRIIDSLNQIGITEAELDRQIKKTGCKTEKDIFYIIMEADDTLIMQTKEKLGARQVVFNKEDWKTIQQ